jgi:hypothetical protein
MRKNAIAIAGIHVREKRTHPLRERPNSRLGDLINWEAHLPAAFHARIENRFINYTEKNILVVPAKWKIANI